MSETGSNSSNTWFADLIGDGSSLPEQMQQIKTFAYASFDRLDQNNNGFLSQEELENALKEPSIPEKEKAFLKFLLENHQQIADAANEDSPDGISRQDLESYFEIIAALL